MRPARALGKNPSTISRYLKEFPDLNLGSRTRPKIDVDVLRRHREVNVNPFRSGSSAGRVFGEVDEATNGHADIPLADAYNAAYNAGKVLQGDFAALAALLGEQLAAMTDPREIVALLRTDYERILRELISHSPDDAAAEGEPRAPGQVTPLHESTPV